MPGHRDCIKNMPSGAAQVARAIPAVAAPHRPMLQTREDGLLARQEEVPAIVLRLNKVDMMVDPEHLQLRAQLTSYGFPGDETP
jgi:translation elongation factor EF-Tu-like GTPase